MVARRQKKNWYEKHLGTTKAGKVYWRLPGVKPGHCCECGKDMHCHQNENSSFVSTSELHEKPVNGNGVFCADCASTKEAVARVECHKAVLDLAKRTGKFPNMKACDSAVRWINHWKHPCETTIPGISQNKYKMPALETIHPNWKLPTVPVKERAAAKKMKAKLRALYKAAARYDANNLFTCFSAGYLSEKAAARKAMKAYFEIAGWKFTPLKAVKAVKGAAE